MKNNSLLELFLGLIFLIVVLYFSYKGDKKYQSLNAPEKNPLAMMYSFKVKAICIIGIIALFITILMRLC